MKTVQFRLDSIAEIREELNLKMEGLKLRWIHDEIALIGIPKSEENETVTVHSAYQLSYNETH